MYLRLSSAVLVLAAVVAAPAPAAADRLKVAVVPGIAVNLDATRVDALSQELAEALRSELDIDAIGGLEVRRQLPTEGLPPDCVASQPCIDDVARRLGARQLLFVVMIDTGTGGAIQVDTTWVDAPGKATASRPAIDIATIGSARAQFAAAAQQLLPDAPVRPRPSAGIGRMSTATPRHPTLPSYLTAGSTVVGLGLGISFGLSARSKYNECKALADHGACPASLRDSLRTTDLLADTGWLIAVAGTVATAVLYSTSSESSHLIVEPAPHGVAVTAVGRF